MTGAIGAAAGATGAQIGVAIVRKALDVQEQQGQAAVQLIQSATTVVSGAKGSVVDVVA